MMGDLREMARAPVAIFERFLGELQRIAGDTSIGAAAGIERVKDLQVAMVREIEESLRRFRAKVGEAEANLVGVLRPPRPSLYQEIQRAAQHLQRLMDLAARREALLRAWEDQPPEAILEEYRGILGRNEVQTAELYEAEAERVLRRKGNAEALQAFLDIRARAEEGRMTPAQRQAKAELEDLERLKSEVTLATQVVASTVKASGAIAAVGAGWRKGGRLRLNHEEQGRTSVLILPGAHPGMTAHVLEVSRGGIRLVLPQELPPGAMLSFILKRPNGRGAEVRLQGEVRWCRRDARTPDSFLAGVRLIPRAGDQWVTMLGRMVEARQESRAVLEGPEG